MAEKKLVRFRSDVKKKDLFVISLSITKEMDSWLQDLGRKIKESGGYKLPKTYIIRSLLNAAMCLKIDASGVKSEKELEDRILHAISKYNGK